MISNGDIYIVIIYKLNVTYNLNINNQNFFADFTIAIK